MIPGSTGGMEVYARELIPRIGRLLPDAKLFFFACREGVAGFDADELGAEIVPCETTASNGFKRLGYEQFRLPLDVRRYKIDVLHSLTNTAPLLATVPNVVAIHDLIPAFVPEPLMNPEWQRHAFNRLVNMSARRADRVLTLSEASLRDLVKIAKISADKIDVIPPAGRPRGEATPVTALRERYDLPDRPLILSPSARRTHKNLPRLFEALAKIDLDPAPILLLPGYQTGQEEWMTEQTERLGVAERVKMLGWISDSDLDGLYDLATCFVFPSYMEGFGLPVLEAMERDLPVATSNVSAMPEAGGDAALYFDPFDVDQIAAAITRLLTDEELRTRLVRDGREHIKRFSWDRAAEQTVDSYLRAVTEGRHAVSRA